MSTFPNKSSKIIRFKGKKEFEFFVQPTVKPHQNSALFLYWFVEQEKQNPNVLNAAAPIFLDAE
jgi:hypothetical protein